MTKYMPSVYDTVVYNKFGKDFDEMTEEDKAEKIKYVDSLPKHEVFASWLEYEGIIGYAIQITNKIEDIFKVKL